MGHQCDPKAGSSLDEPIELRQKTCFFLSQSVSTWLRTECAKKRNPSEVPGFASSWLPSGPRALRISVLCWLGWLAVASAADNPGLTRAQTNFAESQTCYRKQPENMQVAWQYARACFDLADFATNRSQRAGLAEQGIGACRQALARESNSAPLHYYLGLNLGQLARTRMLGALRLVNEMEKEFTVASQLNSNLDYAGPDRSLGLLYRDAPTFGSIGNRAKAREHLQRARELAPQYPENGLILVESELKWNDRNAARSELKALEERLPKARTEFSGAAWASSWADWDPRLTVVRKTLADVAGSEPVRR
jgi:tetratricopeptide (TPR) repeat protein